MKVTNCSACGNEHEYVELTIEKRLGGRRFFNCPERGTEVDVVQSPYVKNPTYVPPTPPIRK